MSNNIKYFYLKLKENFFDADEMILLENMPDGYMYSNILLKLYLRSLKNEGRLIFNDKIPYNSSVLAQITRHKVDVLESAMMVFQEFGLIEVLKNGTIYIKNIHDFIGKSSTEAERKRKHRIRIEAEKNGNLLNGQLPDKCPPEKEIDLEVETDRELELNKKYIIEIIAYLNERLGADFKHSTKKTQSLIKERINEGFTVDDFRTVIDKKCNEWIGTDFEKFLRPETLFSNKFEGYLNQKMSQPNDKFKKAMQEFLEMEEGEFI